MNYSDLARLVSYPDKDFAQDIETFVVENETCECNFQLHPFIKHIKSSSLTDLQEYYTRTFDVNPVCCLEVGWHLFGEQYERGSLMAKLRYKMRELGIDEKNELPDHLSNVLDLLAALPHEEKIQFAGTIVLPAIREMVDGFETNKRVADSVMDLTLKKKERHMLEKDHEKPCKNIYCSVLKSIAAVIKAIPGVEDYPEAVIPRKKAFIPPWEGYASKQNEQFGHFDPRVDSGDPQFTGGAPRQARDSSDSVGLGDSQ